MGEPAQTLAVLGAFLLLGLLTDVLGRRTPLPRVTLLLLFGVLIGPAGLDLVPAPCLAWFPTIATTALVMVGFLLGGSLTRGSLRRHGRAVLWVSGMIVLLTAGIVGSGLVLIGAPLTVALVLGGIATATAPAATLDVIEEAEAAGPLTSVIQGVVAADDAWGLVLFSLLLCVADLANGSAGLEALAGGAWELGGAVLLGVAIGVPMAYLTGRLRPGQPTLLEALGLVLLCGGLALWLGVSFILASVVLGVVVVNLARHHTQPFHAIRGIEWPFLVVFFLLSGASLPLSALAAAGGIGAVYVLLRVVGRIAGSQVGGALGGLTDGRRSWLGIALLPQAGVALGMTLVAAERFPAHRDTILPVAVGATVLFELVGPLCTRAALKRFGEAGRRAGPGAEATS